MDYMSTIYALPGQPGVYEERGLENPNLSLTDPAAWADIFGDWAALSGEAINYRTALALPAVLQAVQLIAGDVAKLPLYVYRVEGEQRTLARDHPLFPVLSRRPNDDQHAFRFWKRMMLHALLWGHAYARIVYGDRLQLKTIAPDRCTPIIAGGRKWYEVTETADPEYLRPEAVLHIANLEWSDDRQLLTLQLARDALGIGRAESRFTSSFFRNGVKSGGIIEIPRNWKDDTVERFIQQVQAKYGSAENAFKFLPLRDGAKYHATSMSSKDAQLVELKTAAVHDVARIFNIPPRLLGLAASSTYKSREEEMRAYFDGALSHWCCEIAGEVDLKLLNPASYKFEVAYDQSRLIEADVATKYQVGAVGIQNKFVLPNEVRQTIGLNPIPGGDSFEKPQPPPVAAEPPQPDEESEENNNGQGRRLRGSVL